MRAGGVTAEEGALCSVALAMAGHLPVGLCSAPRPLLSAPVPDLLIPHPCSIPAMLVGSHRDSQPSPRALDPAPGWLPGHRARSLQ